MSGALRMHGSLLGGVEFDPLSVGWAHAYWVGGPEFLALSLADGAGVATFPDEVSTHDLTQSTAGARPTYRAAGGPGSGPCIEGAAGDWMSSTTPFRAQPLSVVAVAKFDNPGTSSYVLTTAQSAFTQTYSNGGAWWLYGGSVRTGGTDDALWHLFNTFWSGASSVLEVDATANVTGNPGTAGQQNFAIFGNATSNSWIGKALFFGLYHGDVRTDPDWDAFESWALELTA